MLQQLTLPVGSVEVDSAQADRHRGTEGLHRLTESVARHGILQPIGVKPTEESKWKVVFGTGRTLAAMATGLKEIPANVLDKKVLEGGSGVITLVENMLRTDLSGYDQWQGCLEALSQNPTWSNKDLADSLSLDPSSLTRIMSPSKAIPAVVEALKAGKIVLGAVYAITKGESPEEQARLLSLALAGTSRDTLEKEVKKARTPTVPACRLSRVRVLLPGKISIVLTGAELSLEEVADALTEAQREVRRARDQGIDVKAFNAVMSSKAKSGT